MKKIEINLTPFLNFRFTLPTFISKSSLENVLKFLHFFNLILLSFFIFFFIFAGRLGISSSIETDTFKFTIFVLGIIYTIFFFSLVYIRKDRIVDPINFLPILVYALLTTISSVLSTSGGTANTFGILEQRGLSGILILSMIGLYYILNFYIKDLKLYKRFYSILLVSISLFTILAIIFSNYNDSIVLNNINLFILFPLIFSGGLLLKKGARTLILSLLIISILIIFISVGDINLVLQNFATFLFSLTVVSIVSTIYILFRLIRNRKLKKEFNSNYLYLLIPIFLILSLVYLQINSPQILASKLSSFRDIQLALNNLINLNGVDNIVKTISGFGSTTLKPGISLVANIISTQGLIGLLSNIVLFGSLIFIGIRFLNKFEITSTEFKNVGFYTIFIIFFGVYSLFVYPQIFAVILLWIFIGLMTSYMRIHKQKKEDYFTEEFKIEYFKKYKIKKTNLLQYISSFAIVVFGLIILIYIARTNI